MYCNFFGFTEKPFDVTPDPKFLYLTPGHQEMLASLIYGIRERRGFISIVGEVGTGKTTLLNALLDRLDEKTKLAYLFNTAISFEEMLKMALLELGLTNRHESLPRVEAIHRLNDFAIEELAKGHNVVLIVDEAHNLDDFAMENLRLLSNLETRKHKLVQIVLSGQPELDTKLRKPELRQLAQRISLRRYITPLTKEETYKYIEHRLNVAGQKGRSVFSKRAQQMILEHSEGVPRKINILCDNAFLIGYGLRKNKIGSEIVKEAIKDLTWSPFSRNAESPFEEIVSSKEKAESPSALPHPSERVTLSNEKTYRPRLARIPVLLVLAFLLGGAGVLFGNSLSHNKWDEIIQSSKSFFAMKKWLVSTDDGNDNTVLAEAYNNETVVGKSALEDLIDGQGELSAPAQLSVPDKAYDQVEIEEEKGATVLVKEPVAWTDFKEESGKEEPRVLPEFVSQKSADDSISQSSIVEQNFGVMLPDSYNERSIVQQGLSSGVVEEQVEPDRLLADKSAGEFEVSTREMNLENTDFLSKEKGFVVVKRGDFLCKIILDNYGYFREHLLFDLISENPNIKDPDYIVPGQVIKLPVRPKRK